MGFVKVEQGVVKICSIRILLELSKEDDSQTESPHPHACIPGASHRRRDTSPPTAMLLIHHRNPSASIFHPFCWFSFSTADTASTLL